MPFIESRTLPPRVAAAIIRATICEETTLAKPRALVIGGSVGGLFAAHLLHQIGWQVVVFERASGDLGDRGTGIGTRDDLFAVMRRIGLAADAASLGVDVAGRVALDREGNIAHELPVRAVTSAWSRIWRLLRAALPDTAYAGGKSLRTLEQRPNSVAVTFDDGSHAEGELLVAADGVHSTVRALLLPDTTPRYGGYVAWRGAVDPEKLAPTVRDLVLHRMVFGFPDCELMLSIPMPSPQGSGRACHFVWFRPVAEDNLAGLCTDANGRHHGLSIPPPLIRPELIAALKRDAAATLAPQLAALLDATPQIILQPIFDHESPGLAFDRVALIGDAAFVARPHVASGVMKAAVDAETLADVLAGAGPLPQALQRYNTARQPYGAALVERGRHIGATIVGRGGDPVRRAETLMREYGSAGLVADRAITARA